MAALFAGLKGVFTPATIQITMEDETTRTKVRKPHSTDNTEYLLYSSKDPVKGSVTITPLPNRKLEYQQVQCEFTGIIEVFGEKTQSNNFITVTKDLDQEGVLTSAKTYQFDFTSIKKEYETYYGVNVNLRYIIVVKVVRHRALNITQEKEIFFRVIQSKPTQEKSIMMQVGVPGSLHIEFEYSRSQYHLSDCIIGRISFINCTLKVKNMEVAILKKETTFQDAAAFNESDNLMRFEVMDGAPVKGEVIPIRMFLRPLDLTPTYPGVNSAFQVKYFLNIVIFDEDDRRYFKQAEIQLWRKDLL